MILKGKYHFTVLLTIVIAIVSLSCGKESSCFKSTGNIIIEQRAITADVNVVVLDDMIDLVLTQSTQLSLTVEGGKNLLPYINTEISGNELKISSDNRCNFFRDYGKRVTIYLSLPNFTKIHYTGQGNISNTNILNLPSFIFETRNGMGSVNLNMVANNIDILLHTGPTDITITGTCDKLYTFDGSFGWIYLSGLSANDVHVNNAGSGDVIVSAKNSLLVELTGIGNIDYYGDPVVTVSTHSGSGLLRKK